jgi:hypothetical protein
MPLIPESSKGHGSPISKFIVSCIIIGKCQPQSVHPLPEADGPAPGSEDTELDVLIELEVGHGETCWRRYCPAGCTGSSD